MVTANSVALGGYGGLEAHIHVVCAGDRPNELVDAGITSSERAAAAGCLQLVDGQCRFSRLRLIGTTSTFGGRMFHFVVSLVRRDGDRLFAIASMISASFAVYSRKNADKKRKAIDKATLESGKWAQGYSFIPFDPATLSRQFVKKVTNGEGQLIEEPIDNSWNGLLRYFQAPNIRFKVRHPLFLAIRFSNVLVILRDALRFPEEDQRALRSFICSCGFPLNCIRDQAVHIGHGEFLAPWLIAFRNSAFNDCPPGVRQKLEQFMNVVKGPALGFVPDDALVPERYQPTFDVESLGNLYTALYKREFSNTPQDEASNGNEQKRSRANGKDDNIAMEIMRKTEPMLEGHMEGHDDNQTASSNNDSMSHSEARAETQLAFKSYFIALHKELRALLENLVQKASANALNQGLTPDEIAANEANLVGAYNDFTEAVSVHAHVEEHVLFSKLADRVPRVTESYSFDHKKEKDRITEITNIMIGLDGQKAGEVFLKVAELAALHKVHMEKEEEHLLPYFLTNFDDAEIKELIQKSRDVMNYLSTVAPKKEKVNLNNARHKAAIGRAYMATGQFGLDELSDPPDNADDHPSFVRDDDDAMALIESMYEVDGIL